MFRNARKLCSLRMVCLRLPDRKYKALQNFRQMLVNTYQSPVVIKNGHRLDCKKYFRVSPVNNLPSTPTTIFILSTFKTIFPIVLGFCIRRWWLKLSEHEKRTFWHNFRKRYKQIAFVIATFIGLTVIYCAVHTEINPITGKRQLILFSRQQMAELSDLMINQLFNQRTNKFFPRSHIYYQRSLSIATQIINANTIFFKDRRWFIIVIEDPSVNAMVLPNGLIVIFSGLLQNNDAEVGIVLSHEMSHCLLDHHALRLSRELFHEMLWLIPDALIWTIFPPFVAILVSVLGKLFKNLTIDLPYIRGQEIEADKYGLMLAANACIDIQRAIQIWKKMEQKYEIFDNVKWWLSTHPSDRIRIKYIEDLLPNALELRKQQNCPGTNSD